MGKMGYGYGSEYHLRCHIKEADYLSQKVIDAIGGQTVEWSHRDRDNREFVGLEFIQNDKVQENWKSFWPQTGKAQNWDAIGQICFGDTTEWLLLEAKCHTEEIISECRATSQKSQELISSAFEKTSKAFGNCHQPIENWSDLYYQYANRLAVLYFLTIECVPAVNARLLFIYFYGETRKNWNCPKSEKEWLPIIQKMTDWLGIDKQSELFQRVHYLFLPVNPTGVQLTTKIIKRDDF